MSPPEILNAALATLGEVLASRGEAVRIVVVGGVAVNMRRLQSRATADVDVIARAEIERGVPVLIRPDPLPAALIDG